MILHHSVRKKKILSIRSKFGSSETHELLLFKTPRHTYCYVIDLASRNVLFSVSTVSMKKLDPSVVSSNCGKVLAGMIGREAAERCKKIGVKPAFNVAEYRYHGRVKSLIEGFVEIINS